MSAKASEPPSSGTAFWAQPLEDPLIERLSRLDQPGFVAEIGPIYEHSPWIAAEAWRQRPFSDRPALLRATRRVVHSAPRHRQLELIRAHPDLAGKFARAGTLGSHSAAEQGGLKLDRLDDDAFERFDRLNASYRERFGIPFVIAVRAQTRDSIIAAFETRLRHDHETEIATALDEIERIAGFRLADLA